MFCKKCGQEIKAGVKYCQKCGNEVGSVLPKMQGGGQVGSSYQPVQPVRFDLDGQSRQNGQPKQDSNKGNKNNKRVLFLGIGIAVILLAAVLIVLFVSGRNEEPEEEEVEVSLVGEWKSDDLVTLENAFEDLLIEQGIPGWIASLLVDEMGFGELSELTLRFTGNGSILIGAGDVSVGIGTFTYDKLGEGRLVLKYNLDASVLGFGVPVSIAYTSDYTLTADSMEMDFFGCRISFTRKSSGD